MASTMIENRVAPRRLAGNGRHPLSKAKLFNVLASLSEVVSREIGDGVPICCFEIENNRGQKPFVEIQIPNLEDFSRMFGKRSVSVHKCCGPNDRLFVVEETPEVRVEFFAFRQLSKAQILEIEIGDDWPLAMEIAKRVAERLGGDA